MSSALKNIQLLFHSYFLISVLIIHPLFTFASTDSNKTITFSIPAQRLSNALITLSQQSQLPIVFYSPITDNKMTKDFYKTTTTEQAVNKILLNTNLSFSIINNSFIVITKNTPPNNNEINTKTPLPPNLEQIYIYGHPITGSRLTRPPKLGSTPVDIVNQPELALRGATTIGEKLNFLPAVSGNATSTAVTNGGNGTATVTLRGLPANNTLVLVNGRRIAPDGLQGDTTDLNSIAPTAIERIEILKDGASSIYGADAIAGVVNIVMKDHYDGLSLETFYGQSSRADMETSSSHLLWGHTFEKVSALVALTHYKQNAILSRDRTRSANADGRSWGGADKRSSATPAARITLPQHTDRVVVLGQDATGQYLNPDNPSNFRDATNEDLYNFSQSTTAFVPHKHSSLYSHLQAELSNQSEIFLESSFDTISAQTQFSPIPLFTSLTSPRITISADNIYNPFDIDITDIRRRLVEMPARIQLNKSTTKRFTGGFKGVNNNWSWDVSYSWSHSTSEEILTNLVDAKNLEAALGPAAQCVAPCVALNLFGAPGSISKDQLNFISSQSKLNGFSKLSTWSLNTTGPLFTLPAGQLDFAAGLEYRQEATKIVPDRIPELNPTLGGANYGSTQGSRSVIETYMETSLPLIQGQDFINNLTIELSARHSHYSDFGQTTNPKIGAIVKPSESLLLRSTWSKGFRAPSLSELYTVSGESHDSLFDPCSIAANVGTLPGCSQQSDPDRLQYLVHFEGNEKLQPEHSVNNTLGVVWFPTFLPNFTLSVDIFKITQTDVINANIQNIVELNAQTNTYSDLVIRDNNGEIQKIIAKTLNNGKRKVKGLDIHSRYQFTEKNFGHYTLTLNASHIHSYIIQENKLHPQQDIAGIFIDEGSDGLGAIPKWKANIGLIWHTPSWQGAYTIHYISSLEETVPDNTYRKRRINSWTIHDLQLGYTFNDGKELQLLAGIDNVFDTPPPRVASGFNDNLDTRSHELKGQFFYLRVSQKF